MIIQSRTMIALLIDGRAWLNSHSRFRVRRVIWRKMVFGAMNARGNARKRWTRERKEKWGKGKGERGKMEVVEKK